MVRTMNHRISSSIWCLSSVLTGASAFLPRQPASVVPLTSRSWGSAVSYYHAIGPSRSSAFSSNSRLHIFDKMFEEEGPLGKGITVGKIQVSLMCEDRGKGSIIALLQDNARWIADDNEASSLADLAHEVCLSLLRKKDSWVAAASDSVWFSGNDAGKAERQFNDWANAEAAKFEKEYIPDIDGENEGGATIVVVSLVIEIEGDETVFDKAGFSLAKTEEVLKSVASSSKVDEGEVTNAVEVFWTPGDPKETLTSRDCIVDFPELVEL